MARVTGGASAGVSLSARDTKVLDLVAEFGQLSTAHIRAAAFPGLSPNVADRSLRRLLAGNYIVPVGRRTSVTVIGASPKVYRLGAEGRKRYGLETPRRNINKLNEHSLTIADTFLLLLTAHRDGLIVLDSNTFDVEHPVAEGLRADLYAEFYIPARGGDASYYIEVDLGTEPIKRISRMVESSIEEKCQAYRQEYESSGAEYWPTVVFAVLDEGRKRQIGAFVAEFVDDMPEEERQLFRVLRFDELVVELVKV